MLSVLVVIGVGSCSYVICIVSSLVVIGVSS